MAEFPTEIRSLSDQKKRSPAKAPSNVLIVFASLSLITALADVQNRSAPYSIHPRTD